MNLLPECLIADGAGEGADVLVHPHVRRQIVGLCEDLATDLAVLKHPLTLQVLFLTDLSGLGEVTVNLGCLDKCAFLFLSLLSLLS